MPRFVVPSERSSRPVILSEREHSTVQRTVELPSTRSERREAPRSGDAKDPVRHQLEAPRLAPHGILRLRAARSAQDDDLRCPDQDDGPSAACIRADEKRGAPRARYARGIRWRGRWKPRWIGIDGAWNRRWKRVEGALENAARFAGSAPSARESGSLSWKERNRRRARGAAWGLQSRRSRGGRRRT